MITHGCTSSRHVSHSPFHVAQVHFFAPAFAKYNDECLADALRETAESYAQLAAPCLRRYAWST